MFYSDFKRNMVKDPPPLFDSTLQAVQKAALSHQLCDQNTKHSIFFSVWTKISDWVHEIRRKEITEVKMTKAYRHLVERKQI